MVEQWTNDFNPFNWTKYFAQIYRWKEIGKTPAPAPAMVSIDPSNVCQLNCIWCNSVYIRKQNPKMISKESLLDIANGLKNFTTHPTWHNVEAVSIGGGGDPLTNPATQDFINRIVELGIKPSVVTNGLALDKFDLSGCEWAGVSVDAGTRETFKRLKGKDCFDKVINNIKKLTEVKGTVNNPQLGHGISYKYVMHPENIDDIFEAAKVAKEIGCRNIHIRPFMIPYKGQGSAFSEGDIKEFRFQLKKSRELEDENFSVYGITHKFDGHFVGKNDFKKCYAIYMTSTFQPPTTDGKGFNVLLCCDRRGDPRLTHENMTMEQFKKYWGTKEHLNIVDHIDPQKCERCIRTPHNKIYEKAIIENNMSYEFA